MGILGLRGSVLRGKSGWWRGANGRFYRGIPGFSGWARARRFSARRTVPGWLSEKFFKKGWKRTKNRKFGVREVPEGDPRAPYIGCAGRFLGLETNSLAALLEVRFVQGASTGARHETLQRDIRESLLLYRELHMEHLQASSIAHSIEVSPLVRLVIP